MTGAAATHAIAQACAAAPVAEAQPIRQLPHGGLDPNRPMTAETADAAAATPMTSLSVHPGARRRAGGVAARTAAAAACSRVHAQGGCTGAGVHASMHGCSLGGTFVLHPRAQPIESALPEQPIRQLAQAAFVDIISITVACALAEVATDVISAAEQPEAHI